MALEPGAKLADQRVTEWFLREQGLQERIRANTVPPIHTVITISRQFGAGAHTVADKVAAQLGAPWHVWDREIIDAVAQDARVRSDMVEALDERTRSWVERVHANLTGSPVFDEDMYYKHVVKVLLAVGQQGHKIIVGRAAYLVLNNALKVRLRAALQFRAEEAARREGISHEAALQRVRHVDHGRAALVRSYFDRDVDNLDDYDIGLQTDRLGYDTAADVIVTALRRGMQSHSRRRP